MSSEESPEPGTFSADLAARIRSIISGKWGSQREWSRLLGIREQSVSSYVRGEQRPPLETLIRLAEEGGVTVEWLITGLGPKYRNNPRRQQLHPEGRPQLPSFIPLMGKVPAGKPGGQMWTQYEASDALDSLRDLPEDGLIGLRVQGDSMWPTLFDGDVVLTEVTDGHGWQSGQLVVAQVEGATEDYQVKRLGPVRKTTVTLISDNFLHYQPKEYTRTEVQLRGHVLRVLRTPDRRGPGALSDTEEGLLEFYQSPDVQEILGILPGLSDVARTVALANLRQMARLKL